jgi:hypothetical protein
LCISGEAGEPFKFGDVLIDIRVAHVAVFKVDVGLFFMRGVLELSGEFDQELVPNIGQVVSNWIKCINPRSYITSPSCNF